MAISPSTFLKTFIFLFFTLCLLLLCNNFRGQRRIGESCVRRVSQCRIEKLSALEPTRRVLSKEGYTEYFDQFNEQLHCAGVFIYYRTIQPRGLLSPSFSGAPRLVYIIQGRGIIGIGFPGCPEMFQSFQRIEQHWEPEASECKRLRDEHQRIHHFREGDIVTLPAGVASWSYNNGEVPIIAITVIDTSSNTNQPDRQHKKFLLGGRERRAEQGSQTKERYQQMKGNNLLSSFELDPLAEALGVERELGRRIQNPDDMRGEIVHVTSEQQQREREVRQECREGKGCQSNVLEAYRTMKIRQNVGDPMRVDCINPHAGRITTLNHQKLRMRAVRGLLHPNAIVSPHWNVNAHSIMYVLRGCSWVQVVGHRGRTVFDGELRQGQLLVVPQYFAVTIQAQHESFEWVSIKTNNNAIVNHFVGKTSNLCDMPVEVLMNSYRFYKEARRLKLNRGNEFTIFTPKHKREATASV